MNEAQRVKIAGILSYLQGGAVPVRPPGWEEAGYWGKPIVQSNVRPIPPGPDWVILQQVSIPAEYITFIREIIASPMLQAYPAGLEFRVRRDGAIPSEVQSNPGINRHYDEVLPLVRQDLPYVMDEDDHFFIECRNQGADLVWVASAVYGWHYYAPGQQISSRKQGHIDVVRVNGI